MVLLYFDNTPNCGLQCYGYFDHLPQDQPIRIYAEQPRDHLTIIGNEDAQQLKISTPLKAPDEVIISSSGKIKVTKYHRKSRKKAKQVKFSDFKKEYPIFSTFKDLEESSVKQKFCPSKDPHDLIGIFYIIDLSSGDLG